MTSGCKNKLMPNDNQDKIKAVIEKLKIAAILFEPNASEEIFLLKNALETGLKSLGKEIIFFPDDLEISKSGYKEKWQTLLENSGAATAETQTKTIIKIPKKEISVKELSYNENGDFFSLVITSQKGRITKELAIFEEALPEPDMVFCFFGDSEKLENFKDKLKLPTNDKIIFFEPNEKNAATEKIVDLFKLLNADFSPALSGLLFASLIVETNNFQDYSNKDVFSLANFLLSREADANLIKEIMEKEKTNSFVRLLGRAGARTHYDENQNISWSFLAKNDFEKTGAEPSAGLILKISQELEKIKKPAKISVFCWQNNGVFAFLKTLEKSLLLDLAQKLNTSLQSDYFIAGPFQNFSEAEMKIKEVIEIASKLNSK